MTTVIAHDRAETDRVAALESCSILDTPPEEKFDFLCRLAAQVCGAEMAGITFIDGDRQFYKSAVGLEPVGLPRGESFCEHTVASRAPLVIEDARTDDRVSDSPLVTGAPAVRFYAGAPLRTAEGAVLGALCVMDTEPRTLERRQLDLLRGLADQVTALVEQRRDENELGLVRRRLHFDEGLAHVAAWEWDSLSDVATWTPELRELLGVGPEVDGSLVNFLALIHEDDRERVKAAIEAAVAAGGSFSYRARIVRPDGAVRTLDNQCEARLTSDGTPLAMWGATVDVTELVEAERVSREQAAGLLAAFETALDPILVADAERRFTSVNAAACALLGYSSDELLAMRVEDLAPEPLRELALTSWAAFREAGRHRGEVELVKADGDLVRVEFSATADFVPGRHLSLLRDVTDRREAEAAALESRVQLEEAQALTQVGSWEWNLRDRLQVVSDELVRILGHGSLPRQPTYEEFVEYVHPDDRESFVEVVGAALRTREPYRHVFRVITESGEIRTIESYGRVEVDAAGKPARMLGAVQDVSERERTEHDLRLQAEVLDQVPAGVISSGPDRKITQWSHGAELLFKIPRDEAVGQSFDDLDLIPPESEERRDEMAQTLGKGEAWEGEIVVRDSAGRTFPALVTNSPISDSRGEIAGYVGVTMDLTERQTIEKEVGMQGQLLDQIEASVFGMDLDRRITHWNRGAEKLFGWPRDEAMGQLVGELGLVAGNVANYREAVEKQEQHGGSWELEVDLKRKDGTTFPAVATSSTVTGPDGTPIGYVGFSVDVSERMRAEAEASAARLETIKRLAMAVEMRDKETGGHIKRIGEIAAMLAERLGIDSERAALIRVSSTMHDVGKVGVADAILLKPGGLTDEERAEMQKHSRIGHDILAGPDADLDLAATIALTHHERIDGSGYPHGLSGDEIPIEGRIVAVADVFDALTSDRVYRKAFSVDKAVEMMKEGRGTQFDPEILDLLLDDLPSFVEVSRGGGAD